MDSEDVILITYKESNIGSFNKLLKKNVNLYK